MAQNAQSEPPKMSRWADLDTLVRELSARAADPAALTADLPFVYAGFERLCEATDLPSSDWSTGGISRAVSRQFRRYDARAPSPQTRCYLTWVRLAWEP